MHRGFICSWRKSFDSDVTKNVNVWYFWSWCLHKACYSEQRVIMNFQEIILQPGQLIFGRKKAAEEIPLSEQEIRTCIRFLEKIGNLTIKSTNRFSIITITNWSIYQDKECRVNQHINQQLTSKQPATNQQLTTYNKDKQLQQEIPPLSPTGEVGIENNSSPKPKRKKRISGLSPELLESFGKFWGVYPKHQSKLDAEKAWSKLSPQNGQVEIICDAVSRWSKTDQWKKDNGQYVPLPASFLNKRKWEDELPGSKCQLDIEYWKNLS